MTTSIGIIASKAISGPSPLPVPPGAPVGTVGTHIGGNWIVESMSNAVVYSISDYDTTVNSGLRFTNTGNDFAISTASFLCINSEINSIITGKKLVIGIAAFDKVGATYPASASGYGEKPAGQQIRNFSVLPQEPNTFPINKIFVFDTWTSLTPGSIRLFYGGQAFIQRAIYFIGYVDP